MSERFNNKVQNPNMCNKPQNLWLLGFFLSQYVCIYGSSLLFVIAASSGLLLLGCLHQTLHVLPVLWPLFKLFLDILRFVECAASCLLIRKSIEYAMFQNVMSFQQSSRCTSINTDYHWASSQRRVSISWHLPADYAQLHFDFLWLVQQIYSNPRKNFPRWEAKPGTH